jgi:hypothetical protein
VGPKTAGADNIAFPVQSAPGVNLPLLPSANLAGADPESAETMPQVADGDERIRRVEAKLAQLLGEVQALRGGNPYALNEKLAASAQQGQPQQGQPQQGQPENVKVWASSDGSGQQPRYNAFVRYYAAAGATRSPNVETLTRARYKLAEATAAALATFIKEHVKADIEARVDGDKLTVIASQEDQARIAGFIELLDEANGLHDLPAKPRPLPPSQPKADQRLQ